jgi:hypothetical protein
MSNKINISPVISPNIVETISKSAPIKSFGSQLKDKSKETLILGDQTKTFQLDNELDILTKKEQEAGVEKSKTEEDALYKLNTKQITQDQYNKIIETASASLIASKAIISLNQAKLQLDKNNISSPQSAMLLQLPQDRQLLMFDLLIMNILFRLLKFENKQTYH